jgi:hypothetical protein
VTGRLRRLVLHIGCHKTGSTSIQDFAFEDKTQLAAAGVIYPHGLFEDFPRQHSSLYRLLARRDAGRIEIAFATLIEKAAAAGAHTAFLSGEDLCAANAAGVKQLAEIAEKYFDEKCFVIVVRNPRDYALSQFKHHLRYAPPLTEVGFNNLNSASVGHRAIATWTQNFGPGKTLVYDQIAKDLLANFYREVLGVEVEDARRSNVSQDYLTLNIHNIFLKQWLSPEIDKIHWQTMLRHPGKIAFAIEELVARDLSRPSDEDWKITGELPVQGPVAEPGHDPVDVCDKMLTMFSLLREHFVRLRESAAPPVRLNPLTRNES